MYVARCHLKQSFDHPSVCITSFSYTYPSSHNNQVFNLLHCSHRPLDSLDVRTGVMWRMCVYKDWCRDCNEMRNYALLRYWGGSTPKRAFALSICACQFAHDRKFPLVWFSRGNHLFLLLCSPRSCFSKLGQPNIPVSLTIGRTLLQWPTSE
jgi:hypothetical protein